MEFGKEIVFLWGKTWRLLLHPPEVNVFFVDVVVFEIPEIRFVVNTRSKYSQVSLYGIKYTVHFNILTLGLLEKK